jgi:hypothetical protein
MFELVDSVADTEIAGNKLFQQGGHLVMIHG